MSEEKLSSDELENRWTKLRTVLETQGTEACIAAIQSEPQTIHRDQLFRWSIRKLGGGVGAATAELDAMIAIGDAAIRNAMDTAGEDSANVIAYNLSANLCDCWGDGDSRNTNHFEAGLRYADLALELRRKLKKGQGPFSMAYWVRGKHLLSLRKPDESADAFRLYLDAERALARENGGNPELIESAPEGLLNAQAFLGLALLRSGKNEGRAMLDEALGILRIRTSVGEGDAKEDAKVYLDQIEESLKR